ncbi:ATP-dependent helicase HrpB [Marinilabilia salmonicolor]|uniref:ATP-dependent helicase HrpB n=1 Tax=Marinilabilia salmonicolor TaxID=989 RepID=UPI000D4546C0|nr:ATP-dependent helicase HrpB [Marinilabilia salmonicolor]PRZ01461.1 ATP-dependent helicase HrpB [Marinilabilia salmonicolor]
MKLNLSNINLPVKEVVPEIQKLLQKRNSLIVSAPPGAGKSTLLPLVLMHESWLQEKKIIMLEPRRLAARTIAMRMASMLGEEVGQTVGYRIRFDNKISKSTRIEVVTEGILTRMLQTDNALENTGMVIFDEFHERSIFADIALVLTRQSQEVLRPDLRLMVMSATLNLPHLSEMLGAPVVESRGRQYPVEITHTGNRDMMVIAENVAAIVSQAAKNDKGDILAFLPGEGEIRKCEEILKKSLDNISIHPLYGQLPPKAQLAAILPNAQGKRKVVLTTSIAETSLTIEGVSIVVDSGYGRTLQFDPGTGLSRLTTIEITLDAANQRAGRAGRLGPGKCYRLWTLADEHRMEEHRVPEIETSDLASMVLDLAVWGITDVYSLNWPTPPPKSHVDEALETLHQLEALENHKITSHGKEMATLPCHPRIAHMLLMANTSGHLSLAADLAAILEERDPMSRETGIDINLRVEELRRQRREKRNNKRWNQIIKVAESYLRMFDRQPENDPFDPFDTGLLLVHAYPERIASARPGNEARFQLSNGSYALASHKDDLAHEPWLSVAHMDARQGMGKIFLAAPLNPADLKTLIKTSETITWDTRKGGLLATRDLRIGSLVLQSKPLNNPDPEEVMNAICEAIAKEGQNLLNFNDDVAHWQNRIISLSKWRPEENWPDVTTSALLRTCKEWLSPYLNNIRRNEDLKKIDLLNALHYHLSPEKQSALDRLVPQRIKVPSGSFIKISYQPDGSAPILAVRLQEMFGMADTPAVNDGKTPVLLHLLSPGFKPVQVTSDLRSFWNNTYYEVKKELKNRYPKHVWPEDPWKEEAIRGTKRKGK